MSDGLILSRVAPKPFQVQWRTPGDAGPMDCTGLTLQVAESDLGFAPTIVRTGAATAGVFTVTITAVQAQPLRIGRPYRLGLRLVNADNVPVEAILLPLVFAA